MENILENIAVIKKRIAAACQRVNRNPEDQSSTKGGQYAHCRK